MPRKIQRGYLVVYLPVRHNKEQAQSTPAVVEKDDTNQATKPIKSELTPNSL